MAIVADRGDLQPCDPVSAWILATRDEQAGGIHYKKSRYFRRPKTAENKRLPPKTGNFRRLLANFRRDLDAGNGQPKISTIFGGPAES